MIIELIMIFTSVAMADNPIEKYIDSSGGQGGVWTEGGIRASSASFKNGLTASSATLTNTSGYSLQTSSGINVLNGGIKANYFVGDGSALTGLPALGGTVLVDAPLSGTGGALDHVKLTEQIPSYLNNYSTITTSINGKLSNTSTIPGYLHDFSTITTSLNGKLASSGQQVDLSTITTALATKLSTTQQIPVYQIDLATVTTALAAKLSNTATIASYLVNLSTVQAKLDAGVAYSASTATFFGGVLYSNRTRAQLNAITPAVLGETYYCSDCTPKKIVVSTGTGARNFGDAVGGAFK